MPNYSQYAAAVGQLYQQQAEQQANQLRARAQGSANRAQILGGTIGSIGQMLAGIPTQRAAAERQGLQDLKTKLDIQGTLTEQEKAQQIHEALKDGLTYQSAQSVMSIDPEIGLKLRQSLDNATKQQTDLDAALREGRLKKEEAVNHAIAAIDPLNGPSILAQIGVVKSIDPTFDVQGRILAPGVQRSVEMASKSLMTGDQLDQRAHPALISVPGMGPNGEAGTQRIPANQEGFTQAAPPAITPYQQASLDMQKAGQNITASHNQAMEAQAGGAGATPGSSGNLTPEGLDLAASQYRITGQMPPMGMGRTPERFAVINRAAEQGKLVGQTPAATIQKQAAFKGDASALKQMQTLSAGADAAENKALGQIALIRDLSTKVPRTQIPLINSALLSGKINVLGDSNAQQLANAILTFSNEYGKIIEGSTASVSGASDSSRSASSKLVNAAMNQKTLEDVLTLMQREMDLTVNGYGIAMNHITERMGGSPTAPPAPATPATAPTAPAANPFR